MMPQQRRPLCCYTLLLLLLPNSARAFRPATPDRHTTQLFGLFDGVKEAFTAPTLERSKIDSERETPIDRWMGWTVTKENEPQAVATAPADFVDSMDPVNYVKVSLTKPMGIVFEENDADFGGIFVHSLKEDGAAKGVDIQEGDQLVAVQTTKVSGLPFDDALNTIVDAPESTVELVLFRGTAQQFYGPTGASQEWLDEFIGVETTTEEATAAE